MKLQILGENITINGYKVKILRLVNFICFSQKFKINTIKFVAEK